MLSRLYIPSILSQGHIITKKAFYLCFLKAVESLSYAIYLSPLPLELLIYKQENGTNNIIDVHSKDWEGQEVTWDREDERQIKDPLIILLFLILCSWEAPRTRRETKNWSCFYFSSHVEYI